MKFNQLFNFDNLGQKLGFGLIVLPLLILVILFIGALVNLFGFIIIPIIMLGIIAMYIVGSILEYIGFF